MVRLWKVETPRCDLFFKNRTPIKEKAYYHYGIPKRCRLALFAPTFRDSKIAQTHGMDFSRLTKVLCSSTGDSWVTGCRYHPNLKDTDAPPGSISMTDYPDMQELIAAADLLITDYSSCMFDMALNGKPCILFAPDITEYTARERKLYFSWNELPFLVTTNMDDLAGAIEKFDVSVYNNKVEKFLHRVGNYEDGCAAARVAKYIEQKRRAIV